MTRRSTPFAVVLFVALATCAGVAQEPAQPTPPSPAGDPISVQISDAGTILVVTDHRRRTMAIYGTDGDTVRLLGVRRLDADFSTETAKETAAAPPDTPSENVRGQDPPSFARPPKAVRLSSQYNAAWGEGESWSATYAVPGSLDEVHAAVRAGYEGWTIDIENSLPGFSQIRFSIDDQRLEFRLEPYRQAPGWVSVAVSEERHRE